jgi:RecJ-like exonuclease
MQDRQSSILMQQQTQTEMLMKQIQAQMESELRSKSELVRNQLSILTEIQNPQESIDLQGLLSQVQQTTGPASTTTANVTKEVSIRDR